MIKIVAAALAAVCMAAVPAEPSDAVDFQQVVVLSSEENAQETIQEAIQSVSWETLHRSWGEPDGSLFGLWGDIWDLDEERYICVYYDAEGHAEEVKLGNISRKDR